MLKVYEKPTCTTCRNLRALLEQRGVPFESIDYHRTGFGESQLRELLAKMALNARDILRTREPLVAELGLNDPAIEEARLIDLMVEHPQLVQRPIVELGGRALLARPIELALDLLD